MSGGASHIGNAGMSGEWSRFKYPKQKLLEARFGSRQELRMPLYVRNMWCGSHGRLEGSIDVSTSSPLIKTEIKLITRDSK